MTIQRLIFGCRISEYYHPDKEIFYTNIIGAPVEIVSNQHMGIVVAATNSNGNTIPSFSPINVTHPVARATLARSIIDSIQEAILRWEILRFVCEDLPTGELMIIEED